MLANKFFAVAKLILNSTKLFTQKIIALIFINLFTHLTCNIAFKTIYFKLSAYKFINKRKTFKRMNFFQNRLLILIWCRQILCDKISKLTRLILSQNSKHNLLSHSWRKLGIFTKKLMS